MIQTKKMEYHDGETLLEGFYAYDDTLTGKRPLVLVCHDWSGRNEFAEKKAQDLAALGYIGFALDMYGKGKIGKTNEEKMALMQPFKDDRALLVKRIQSALDAAIKIPDVNINKIAAIGFCFGGLCVLDLARSGADIKGVVSFHGLFSPPPFENKTIKAKILALHGHDDPMATPDQLLSFEREMTDAKVDWQVHVYGNTKHAFTNPLANDPSFGTVFNAEAAKRSWIAMKNFFEEIFA